MFFLSLLTDFEEYLYEDCMSMNQAGIFVTSNYKLKGSSSLTKCNLWSKSARFYVLLILMLINKLGTVCPTGYEIYDNLCIKIEHEKKYTFDKAKKEGCTAGRIMNDTMFGFWAKVFVTHNCSKLTVLTFLPQVVLGFDNSKLWGAETVEGCTDSTGVLVDCGEELNFACAINVCKDDEVLFGEYCIHALTNTVAPSSLDSNCKGRGYGVPRDTSSDLQSLLTLGVIVTFEHDTEDESLDYLAAWQNETFKCYKFSTNGTVPVECLGSTKSFCYSKGKICLARYEKRGRML